MVPLDEPRDIRNGSAPAARNWPARSRRRTCAVTVNSGGTLSIDDEGNGTTGAGRMLRGNPTGEGCEMALREESEGAPRVTTALLASSRNSAAPHREVRRIF
jgi:hypothetical protein